ncbi:hypothetical protein [Streptosporangium sp. NPDC051022]|uniref:hypothetical protein n=1 Tax=Streptosporangium sp. NPDC051022 TaxID=3155752 RepID=UPI0034413B4F
MSHRNHDLLHAAKRLARTLGVDPDAVVSLSIELEDGRSDWTAGELLLLALDRLAAQRTAPPAAVGERDVDFLWTAEVHRDSDRQLLGREVGVSWADALRDALHWVSMLHNKPWTLTLLGPHRAEARFRTRAGVEAAMRAQQWAGVMEAMQREWVEAAPLLSPELDAELSRPVPDLARVREFAVAMGVFASEIDQAVAEQMDLRRYLVDRATGADHVEAMLRATEGSRS